MKSKTKGKRETGVVFEFALVCPARADERAPVLRLPIDTMNR